MREVLRARRNRCGGRRELLAAQEDHREGSGRECPDTKLGEQGPDGEVGPRAGRSRGRVLKEGRHR